jgi:DNA-binding CsgD family transcriptional regulator
MFAQTDLEERLIWSVKEYNSKEISEVLNLSVNTIESHRKNLILKFHVKNTTGLVKQAYEKGFEDFGE